IETDKISERYIAPCFVNSLEAYDGEVNLDFDENLVSNEYAVKLCLDYENQNHLRMTLRKQERAQTIRINYLISILMMCPSLVKNFLYLYARWGRATVTKKRIAKNLNLFYQDIRPSSSAGGHLTQEEAEKEALQ
nr:hypothetical protein [Tanacetum cinerariifolium]